MNPIKRVGLVVLLAMPAALFAASPTLAGSKLRPIVNTYELSLPETDPPEPQASGQLTLTIDPPLPGAGVQGSVSCRKLTPGNEYLMEVLAFSHEPGLGEGDWGIWFQWDIGQTLTADTKGRLSGEFVVGVGWYSTSVDCLWVWDNEGNLVLKWQR
ncbi:MAG: hypothetical protein ACOX1P_29420 [Thermoguttaceae bacterium]|jgi:hypothetical protein